MNKIELTELIEAGAHFGHLTRRWNPKMKPYIFMEKNGIHIIDLYKTEKKIDEAAEAMIAGESGTSMFAKTKLTTKANIAPSPWKRMLSTVLKPDCLAIVFSFLKVVVVVIANFSFY